MPFIVQSAGACMPSNCWGCYRRVAVLEVLPGFTQVRMISRRAVGVVRVVRTWEKCNVGLTKRCAYRRALAAAAKLAAKLNAGEERAEQEREQVDGLVRCALQTSLSPTT